MLHLILQNSKLKNVDKFNVQELNLMDIRIGMWNPEIEKCEFINVEFSDSQFLAKGNHRDFTVENIIVENLSGSINQLDYQINFDLNYSVYVGLVGMGVAVYFKPPIEGNLIQINGIVNCRLQYPTERAMARGYAYSVGDLSIENNCIKVSGGRPGESDRNKSIISVVGSYIIEPPPPQPDDSAEPGTNSVE